MGRVAWWAWLLIGWGLTATALAFLLGGAAQVIKRAERLGTGGILPEEPPDDRQAD